MDENIIYNSDGIILIDSIKHQIDNNIISVNCGKICGIFDFEEYIKNYLVIL